MSFSINSLPTIPENAKFFLDSPTGNMHSSFWVRGWAIEKSNGISKISVYLDGKKILELTKKFPRPDVEKSFPNYKNSINSGFAHFLQNIDPGFYKLQFTITIFDKEYLSLTKKLDVLSDHSTEEFSKIMKNDWNLRAEGDVKESIYARTKKSKSFEEVSKIRIKQINEILTKLFPAEKFSDKKMLEIGCGIGRLAGLFSNIFSSYTGVDVSDRMIEIAKTKLNNVKNVEFFVNNGLDLAQIRNESMDFVFEGFVFQHIPKKEIVENYCKETFRVLRNGGHFMALFWKNKLEKSVLEKLKLNKLKLKKPPVIIYEYLYTGMKIDNTNDTTWGVQFDQNEITTMLSKIGFKNFHFYQDAPIIE